MITDCRKMISDLSYIVQAEFSALFKPRNLTFPYAIEYFLQKVYLLI